MYTTTDCNDKDKYYKWKSTSTCICVPVDLKPGSVFTDHEPLQEVIPFSDGTCKKPFGSFSKGKCTETASSYWQRYFLAIGSL
ncbi:hypothetical protein EAF04_009661 [Stromatinia cepivora]|nr:hypothetical protein EAF04_009661 [Stromatinia cepivora]